MSELNENVLKEAVSDDEKTEEVEIEVKEAAFTPEKEKKKHPILKTIGIILLSGAMGFVGGFAGTKVANATQQTVIYKTVEQAPQENVIEKGTIQGVIKNVKDSVVEINTETISNNPTFSFFGIPSQSVQAGAGSGVIVSEDGYILTCAHVIDGATTIKVILTNSKTYEATVVGSDSKSDIAVIKIDEKNLDFATFGDSDTLNVGDDVLAIGNPLGSLGGTATSGIVSALNREVIIGNHSMNLIQTDAAINEGNSGGALFNSNGLLVGITNAKSVGTTVEGLGFAIPINDAQNIMNQLITSGKVTDRPTLGVYISELEQDQGNYKAGVYITGIIEGSGAQKAELQPYDRIIAVNDVVISNYIELSKQLEKYKVGDTVAITVVRENMQLTVDVTLTSPIE